MKLHDALAHLHDNPDETIVFAGGTDLMVQFHAGMPSKQRILDISPIDDLKGIFVSGDYISIGALTSYSQIREHQQMRSEFPMLVAAAKATGAWAIQNQGTIGGNIANASPAADTPPALLAYEARLIVGSQRGRREINYCDFHRGYKLTELKKDELILSILIPRRRDGFLDYYEKVGARAAQAISKVGIAASARNENGNLCDVKIAYSSVAPMPLRCAKTEKILEGKKLNEELIMQAQAQLADEISPISDIRSEAVYRKEVALNLLRFALPMLSERKC